VCVLAGKITFTAGDEDISQLKIIPRSRSKISRAEEKRRREKITGKN
jgi:hypothetical protein